MIGMRAIQLFGFLLLFVSCSNSINKNNDEIGVKLFSTAYFHPKVKSEITSTGYLENNKPNGVWEYLSDTNESFNISWNEMKVDRLELIVPDSFFYVKKLKINFTV